jgi:hypothetical protein
MSLADLSEAEKKVVLQCLTAIADGDEIEDWEFYTRLGITRNALKSIVKRWPQIDEQPESGDSRAINNCFNEVCNGIWWAPHTWSSWFELSRDEVCSVYERWASCR